MGRKAGEEIDRHEKIVAASKIMKTSEMCVRINGKKDVSPVYLEG